MELPLANFDVLKRLNLLGGLTGFPLRNSGGIEKKETSFDFANWQSGWKNVGLIKIKWKVHQLHSFHLPSRYLETNDFIKVKINNDLNSFRLKRLCVATKAAISTLS